MDGRPQIDADAHPLEAGLFNNPLGVIDGNSYSFLTNALGVAINGFPANLDPASDRLSNDVHFENVKVIDQRAFVNEVVALDADSASPSGTAAIDPVGAVFQVWNVHPETGEPVTVPSATSVPEAFATAIRCSMSTRV